jgi:hypothetical protein
MPCYTPPDGYDSISSVQAEFDRLREKILREKLENSENSLLKNVYERNEFEKRLIEQYHKNCSPKIDHKKCRHPFRDDHNLICEKKGLEESIQRKLTYYHDQSDEVTDLLCKLCTYLEKNDLSKHFDEKLVKWWEKHKLFDQERGDK